MKKILVLLLVLILAMTLFACGDPTPESPSALPETTVETESTPTVATTEGPDETGFVAPALEDCVRDYVTDHISYSDEFGNTYEGDYAVPEILLDSSDAKQANDDILSVCQPQLNESYEARDNGTSLFCYGIEYNAWIADRYLTVTVLLTNDWGCDQYLVFTFDLTDGSKLDNEDFAAYLSTTEDALREDIATAMLREYDSAYADAPEEVKDDFYNQQREKTGSADNVLSAELFIDADGTVGIHCDIYSIAGADSYEHICSLYA